MGDRKTYTLRFGGETNLSVTPLGIKPEELLSRIYGSGNVKLVVLADSDHTEHQIMRTTTDMIKKGGPSKYFSEYEADDQEAYDRFAKSDKPEDIKKFKAVVNNPDDYYAPSVDPKETDPKKKAEREKLREDFFSSKLGIFEATKDKKIPVVMVDQDVAGSEAAANASNKMYYLQRDFQISKHLRNADGTPITKEPGEKELTELKKKIYTTVKDAGISVPEEAVMNASWKDLTDISKEFYKDIGLDYDKAHSAKEVREAASKRLSELGKEKQQAENVRDSARDQKMAGRITSNLGNDEHGLLLIGAGHLGKPDEGRDPKTTPNLEAILRDKLKDGMVRVDIIPVGKGEAEILGVAMGGKEGADFTIFVPGERVEFGVRVVKDPVAVENGPHAKRFEEFQKSKTSAEAPGENTSLLMDQAEFSRILEGMRNMEKRVGDQQVVSTGTMASPPRGEGQATRNPDPNLGLAT